MASRISKEAEKKMTDALEKAADLIAQGKHPNDALIKTASEAQIPAGHIHLMVNAINTGRTNAQRLTHDDPLEKAGSFPLADTSVVLATMFPDKVQTKAAAYHETTISNEYKSSPVWIHEKKVMEKSARKLEPLTEKKYVADSNPDAPFDNAMKKIAHMKIDIAEKRIKIAQIREHAIKLAAQLTEYFKLPGHIPLTEVKENSQILFGKQAEMALAGISPGKYSRKEATPVNVDVAPYSYVHQAIDLANKFVTLKKAYDDTVKAANTEAEELINPFVQSPRQSVVMGLYSRAEKQGGIFSDLVNSGFSGPDAAKGIGRKLPLFAPPADNTEDDIQGLMDPTHDTSLRNIRAESLLNDLMANDEVIRGYNPEEVVDAFNEVSQLTPYAVNRKAIMRDLMRRRLTGGAAGLDNYTVGDALKTQQTLQSIDTPKSEQLSVLSGIGAMKGPHAKGQGAKNAPDNA
jgi:hypothetical protein